MKYPPIEGGVSAHSYWLARGLADAGHEVHVVTNAGEVEEEFRIRLAEEDGEELETSTPAGGRVRVHPTERFSPRFTHIPQSNPFVSKLTGMATDVVRRFDCELIFSYYLEPYGVAAHLAAEWTGVPHVVRHAETDLGRLMDRTGLGTAYYEVFRRAAGISTGNAFPFLGMGVEHEAIYVTPPLGLPAEVFSSNAEPLDLARLIPELQRAYPEAVTSPGLFDASLPTIGIYGKSEEAKGFYDLLATLAILRRQGSCFNFVAVTGGPEMEKFRGAVTRHGLDEVTWILPFLPHWRVPSFLRACRAVCFLEREPQFAWRHSGIPREVLACGVCLVLSGAGAAKQYFRRRMVDGDNLLLVDDPRAHDALAAALRRVIEDPGLAEEIGFRGVELVATHEDYRAHMAVYESMLADVVRRHRGRPSTWRLEDRGLSPSRSETLQRFAYPLTAALGADCETALASYQDAVAQAPPNPFDDALGWCRHLRVGERAEELAEAVRFAERVLWLGRLEPRELAEARFDVVDVLPSYDRPWRLETLGPLFPRLSNWLRIESFDRPPAGLPAAAAPGPCQVLFNKLPSLNGRYFGVNAATARLLQSCDGRKSVAEILAGYHQNVSEPGSDLGSSIVAALQRFYREELIVFTDSRAGR